jgi:Domain of unknown function (DUF932)
MSAILTDFNSTASARILPLDATQLAHRVPAAFADRPADKTSAKYVFLSTKTLIDALFQAGFVATAANQTHCRRGSDPAYARHMLRFQHPREAVALVDAIPQIVLINAHDGSSSYDLRAGLYRPVCTNGLMVQLGDFGLIHVPHRGNVVRNVVDAAMAMIRDFGRVGEAVQQMATFNLTHAQRLDFARQALAVRYRQDQHQPVTPEQVTAVRREADARDDVWTTYNVIQENLMRGGLTGRSATGRNTCTRTVSAIREDVRINAGLWQLAMNMISG